MRYAGKFFFGPRVMAEKAISASDTYVIKSQDHLMALRRMGKAGAALLAAVLTMVLNQDRQKGYDAKAAQEDDRAVDEATKDFISERITERSFATMYQSPLTESLDPQDTRDLLDLGDALSTLADQFRGISTAEKSQRGLWTDRLNETFKEASRLAQKLGLLVIEPHSRSDDEADVEPPAELAEDLGFPAGQLDLRERGSCPSPRAHR